MPQIFTAKLIIDDIEVNVLHYHISFDQRASENGKPSQRPLFLGLSLTVEVNKKLDLGTWAVADYLAKQIEIQLKPVVEGGRSRRIKLFDAHLVTWKTNFSAVDNRPMSETLFITAAGVEDTHSAGVYSAKWRKTFDQVVSEVTPVETEPVPVVAKVHWINPETKDTLEKTRYAEQVALSVRVENPSTDDVEISISKKDGTEFESGQKTLVFNETLDEDGMAELGALEIKEQWEGYKTSDIDQLVAKVVHSGSSKQSKPLEIVPPPKVLVNFRTCNKYKGEYGFDWIRMGDTGKPGDVWYKDIIGEYIPVVDENGNDILDSKGKKQIRFIQNDSEYINLGKKFEMPQHPIKANDKYVAPVLALLPNKKATLTLKVEIEGSDAQNIIYKYDDTYFKLNKTEISHKTVGKKELEDDLTIECIKEFGEDQFIEVEADGKFAGKLKVVANDKDHRYKADILLIEVSTKLSSNKNTGKFLIGKNKLSKYFNQVLANVNFETVKLDLSDDITFNKMFAPEGVLINAGNNSFQDYLISSLGYQYKNKDFSQHYKVFFIDEEFVDEDQLVLLGQAYGISSFRRSVIVLRHGLTDNTTVHEIFHAMGLHHSFSNESDFTYKINKTDNIMDYSDLGPDKIPIISTWQWQWDIIRSNIDKE